MAENNQTKLHLIVALEQLRGIRKTNELAIKLGVFDVKSEIKNVLRSKDKTISAMNEIMEKDPECADVAKEILKEFEKIQMLIRTYLSTEK